MNRQEKAEEISEIRELLDGAQLVVLTKYEGLNVERMVRLRREIRQAGGHYRVMKNTLARRATEETPFVSLDPHFSGPVGVAITRDDPATTAKILVAFKKDNPAFELKAGIVPGGKVLDAKGLETLSQLPSKDQLRGQLIGLLQAVPRNFVGVLAGVPRTFVGVLEARRRQLAGE